MIWYSIGWFMGYILCTRRTIQILDQYIRKQDGVYLSGVIAASQGLASVWRLYHFQVFPTQGAIPEEGGY